MVYHYFLLWALTQMDKYCVVLKIRKGLLKVEDIRPVKIMLLHDINDHILSSRPSYSGVYQDEAKIGALQMDKYYFWVGTKPKKN